MIFIENTLEFFDDYFSPKKPSEKWFIILAVIALISYLAYVYLLPYAEKKYNKSEKIKNDMQVNLTKNSKYLDSITIDGDREFYVKKVTKEIFNKKKNLKNTSEKIDFVNKHMNQLSDLIFDKKSWSIFLNSITSKANSQNIDIVYLANHYVDRNSSFGHVLEIEVGCRGSFKQILKFMNELEQNTLVTDIYGTKFTMGEESSNILADINISVWGINH